MNTLILGLPRNGKGLYGAQMGIDELRHGTRPIIGNFAWEKMPWVTRKHEMRCGLLDYLDAKYGDTFNASERIFRISDEATSRFYLYRALSRKQVKKLEDAGKHLVGYRQVVSTDNVMSEAEFNAHKDLQLYVADHELRKDKNGREVLVSFNPVLLEHSGGVMNIADECWRFWPARSWQSTSEADVFYNAQHGKFGDDNLFITHRHNDIDSVIVDRCQQSVVLTHHGKLSIWMFRRPNIYTASIYSGRPQPSKEPMSTKRFMLDAPGLGACYDTSSGVGVTGRGDADRGARKTGLPFFILPVIGVIGVLAVAYLFHMSGHLLGRLFAVKKPLAAHSAVAPAGFGVPAHEIRDLQVLKDTNEPVAGYSNVRSNEIFCLGWIKCGDIYYAMTSDGETYSSADHELDFIRKREISILGKIYKIRPLPRSVNNSQPIPSQYARRPEDYGIVTPSAPFNQIQIIPFGNRNQPTQLPPESDEQNNGGFSAQDGHQGSVSSPF